MTAIIVRLSRLLAKDATHISDAHRGMHAHRNLAREIASEDATILPIVDWAFQTIMVVKEQERRGFGRQLRMKRIFFSATITSAIAFVLGDDIAAFESS